MILWYSYNHSKAVTKHQKGRSQCVWIWGGVLVGGQWCIWCVVYLVFVWGAQAGGGWSCWWQLMEAIQFKGTGCRCVCWCSSCHLWPLIFGCDSSGRRGASGSRGPAGQYYTSFGLEEPCWSGSGGCDKKTWVKLYFINPRWVITRVSQQAVQGIGII